MNDNIDILKNCNIDTIAAPTKNIYEVIQSEAEGIALVTIHAVQNSISIVTLIIVVVVFIVVLNNQFAKEDE